VTAEDFVGTTAAVFLQAEVRACLLGYRQVPKPFPRRKRCITLVAEQSKYRRANDRRRGATAIG
jgi:hypothetical protein